MKFIVAVIILNWLAPAQNAKLDFSLSLKISTKSNRITNGQNAKIGAAPFLVSLKSNEHFCGGSIIDPHWIVTAAHCLFLEKFQVIAGLHTRSNETGVQIRQVTSRKQQIQHESFTGQVGSNDIGLIYIQQPFKLNATSGNAVDKIKLADGKYLDTGNGTIYGWGGDNSGTMSNILQTINMTVIGYEECKQIYNSVIITKWFVCAYNKGTTDGTCGGDSGGPLVHNTREGLELVGTVSFGTSPCVTTKNPSVFSKVSAYKPWIDEKIRNYNKSDIFY